MLEMAQHVSLMTTSLLCLNNVMKLSNTLQFIITCREVNTKIMEMVKNNK